ncbi:putative ubiquitin-protein ligase [Corchorus olitorius]|uniref:Ubiquitin-protein ligase n=1 Tax=Corchorus olitorius TaxID=93759 RepID=A0A1R3I543_9ROSI|nr:putative ubiquitin-protein ligase [Corchorus olitorius]
MASSQVEIVSSQPFGCVLRDRGHNRNERYRESNVRAVQAVFEKNFKDLVRDHIHGCISLSSSSSSSHEKNPQDHIHRVASWVSNNEQSNGNNPHKLRLLNKNQNNNNIKTSESLPVTPRLSRVLDRWVTRQAEDVKASASTIEKNVTEAEPEPEPLLVASSSNNASSSSTTSMASNSNTKNVQNPSPSFSQNRGASSLVQIWEARLNRSNSINSNHTQTQNMGPPPNGASSGLSCNENNAIANATPIVEEPSKVDSFEEKFDNPITNNEDCSVDWESRSDRTAQSEPPSCSKTFDARERERLRVADIIKRLTNVREDANDSEQTSNVPESLSSLSRERRHHSSTADQAEPRCFSPIINSPRLRGRQAFNDLLMQIERDRTKELGSLAERQAVSKFSQRGRLQSMLRLRCLQRGQSIQDKFRSNSAGAQVNRLPQKSTISHLRGKFGTSGENPVTSQNDSAPAKCLHKEVSSNKSAQLEKSSTFKMRNEDTTHHQNVSSSAESMNKSEGVHEQSKPASDHALQQKTKLEVEPPKPTATTTTTTVMGQSDKEMEKTQYPNNTQKQKHILLVAKETVETISSLMDVGYNQNGIAEQQDKRQQQQQQQQLLLDLQQAIETIETKSFTTCIDNEMAQEENIDNQQPFDLESQGIAETITSYIDQDENEICEELDDDYEQYYGQGNYDWFSNIARPKSYWEGLRQAWYQEMLSTTTTSKGDEIRQLLERGNICIQQVLKVKKKVGYKR